MGEALITRRGGGSNEKVYYTEDCTMSVGSTGLVVTLPDGVTCGDIKRLEMHFYSRNAADTGYLYYRVYKKDSSFKYAYNYTWNNVSYSGTATSFTIPLNYLIRYDVHLMFVV